MISVSIIAHGLGGRASSPIQRPGHFVLAFSSAPRVPLCHARAWQTIPHFAMAARCREAPTGASGAPRDRAVRVRPGAACVGREARGADGRQRSVAGRRRGADGAPTAACGASRAARSPGVACAVREGADARQRGAVGRQRGATGTAVPVRPGGACDDRGHAWGPKVSVASSSVLWEELPRLSSRWRAKRAGFSVACWRLDSSRDPCQRARPPLVRGR